MNPTPEQVAHYAKVAELRGKIAAARTAADMYTVLCLRFRVGADDSHPYYQAQLQSYKEQFAAEEELIKWQQDNPYPGNAYARA